MSWYYYAIIGVLAWTALSVAAGIFVGKMLKAADAQDALDYPHAPVELSARDRQPA